MIATNIVLQPVICITMAVAGLISLSAAYQFGRTIYGFRWIAGLSAAVSLFILGAGSVAVVDQKGHEEKNEAAFLSGHTFLCRIESRPVAKGRIFSGSALTIAGMNSTSSWNPLKTRIMIYFKEDSLCNELGYGDLIIIKGNLDTIAGPPNPHMFNYSKYLDNRQIYHQLFVDKGNWTRLGRTGVNPLFLLAEKCRMAFLETFRQFSIVGQDFALVSALLLGNSEYLDAEIRQEFSYAGATHVLSVSGLHVGIVYIAADKMLFFLKRGRKTRRLHTILTILLIWIYAVITGLCTSVTRASLMFSLVAAGKMLKRSSENYNVLIVSAFLQVLINPFETTQVGFQLSYLAVLGIFAFYKPTEEMISTENRIISWLWPLISVSLAAQLATSPLSCYYFNMFPVYFLIANLIVVPLSGLIIYLAIALLAAGTAGITHEWLALPLKWGLQLMRGSVDMIQSWPGAVIEPIVMTESQVLLFYLAIIAVFAFFVLEKRQWAFVFLASFICIAGISTFENFRKMKNNTLAIYNVNGSTAIDLIAGGKVFFITDSLLMNDDNKIGFQIMPNRIEERAREISIIKTNTNIASNELIKESGIFFFNRFGYFKGKNFMILDETCQDQLSGNSITVDLAIISGKGRRTAEKICSAIKMKEVVIDSSVPAYEANRLKSEFEELGIPTHYVKFDGAYVLKW